MFKMEHRGTPDEELQALQDFFGQYLDRNKSYAPKPNTIRELPFQKRVRTEN
jgi:hypothetical protein